MQLLAREDYYGARGTEQAWQWLTSQGSAMSLRTFQSRLRIMKEQLRIDAEKEKQRRLDAEAATNAHPAVAMLNGVPLGASIVAEGVPVAGPLKRTHEAALGSSDVVEAERQGEFAAEAFAHHGLLATHGTDPLPRLQRSTAPSTYAVPSSTDALAAPAEPCAACAEARDVMRATACYHVFDALGRGEVLCPWCYGAREAELASTGGCRRVTRINSAGRPMLSATRGPAVPTEADEAEYRKLRDGVAAAAKKGDMGPVQGGRTQLTHGAANPEMRTAMAAAITNRQDAVNETACRLLRPKQTPITVHAKEIEIVHARAAGKLLDAESGKGANEAAPLPLRVSKSGPGVVLRQSVHVDPMPPDGCQTFILLQDTEVHTMVYDTSMISREDVAQALCATAEQLKCPRWQELVAHSKDLLAAALLATPTPALIGTLPAGTVICFASGLPHFGQELPCASTGECERSLLIFTASLDKSGEDALSQKQVWDAIAQLGNPEGMFALCERNDMLRETLLADEPYFKSRTRNMFSNGKPELTWTPEMWERMLRCVQDRVAPSAFLSNRLREQARFTQLNNGDGNEPSYWCNFWTPRDSAEPITAAMRWHEWRLRDSPGGEGSRTVLLRLGRTPWESEVFHVHPDSCGCIVEVYEADAKNEAGRSLRDIGTFKLQAGDRVRIVPTAVDVAAGNVLMSRWTEDEQGKFCKSYMCFGRLGEEMEPEGDTVDCDNCLRQITEARFLEDEKTGQTWCLACRNSAPADANQVTQALALPSKRFEGCPNKELRAELTRLGVKGISSKNKDDLKKLIDGHGASPDGLARNRLY